MEAIAQRAAVLAVERLREDRDRWLDSRAAVEYLGVSLTALHKLTAARRIAFSQAAPGCRCWFRRADLDAFRGS